VFPIVITKHVEGSIYNPGETAGFQAAEAWRWIDADVGAVGGWRMAYGVWAPGRMAPRSPAWGLLSAWDPDRPPPTI